MLCNQRDLRKGACKIFLAPLPFASMDKQKAIDLAGGVKQLAELLGITHQAIYAWPAEVPRLQVYRLKELRPKWFKPTVAK